MAAMKKVCLVVCVALLLVHDAFGVRASPKAPFDKVSKKGFNAYIVQVDLQADVNEVIRSVEGFRKNWAKATQKYDLGDLRGFALKVSGTKNAESLPEFQRLLEHANVLLVEEDAIVTTVQQATPPSWGLDRIDQRTLPLNNNYTYTGQGTGVCVFVVDTGININHNEFARTNSTTNSTTSRLLGGRSFVTGSPTFDDLNGHGTHCAGTIGGTTYGVAKDVSLVSVRVLDASGSGFLSSVISGIDWAANFAGTFPQCRKRVISMSLGGSRSSTTNRAVANAVRAGVVVVVAAGNEQQDACNTSPASAPAAITVGATDTTDNRAWYSNFGVCLDVFAPGSGITSAWIGNSTAMRTISGTSMATPHVSGVAALLLEKLGNVAPSATLVGQVRNTIVNQATNNVVVNPGNGSPNKLLFSLI